MRGEHVKNKAQEILYRLSLKSEFQSDIQKFRKTYGIPEKGLSWDDVGIWHAEREDLLNIRKKIRNKKFKLSDPVRYHYDQALLLEKYKIPATNALIEILDLYVLSGFVAKPFFNESNVGIFLELPKSDTEGRASVAKLIIRDNVSQDEAVDFLRKKWPLIKHAFTISTKKPVRRIRSTNHPQRNARILELHSLTKEELEQLAGRKRSYKEWLIADILGQEGFSVSRAAIKKVLQRSSRAKKDI